MTENQGVVPMLSYEDGEAAMDWLAEAFGFVEATRMVDDGRLSHGEMNTGHGAVMMASGPPGYQGPRRHRQECAASDGWLRTPYVVDGVLVLVDDVDAHHERAMRAGATILSPLEDGLPGRRYRAEDLDGHRWMFLQR